MTSPKVSYIIIDYQTVLDKWSGVVDKYPIFQHYPIHDLIADTLTHEELTWGAVDEWIAEESYSEDTKSVIEAVCSDIIYDVETVKRKYIVDEYLLFAIRFNRWISSTSVLFSNINEGGIGDQV